MTDIAGSPKQNLATQHPPVVGGSVHDGVYGQFKAKLALRRSQHHVSPLRLLACCCGNLANVHTTRGVPVMFPVCSRSYVPGHPRFLPNPFPVNPGRSRSVPAPSRFVPTPDTRNSIRPPQTLPPFHHSQTRYLSISSGSRT